MRRFSMVAAVLVLCLVCTADAQAGPVRNVLHRGRCVVQSVVKKTAAVVRGTVQGVRAGVASARCQ